MFDDDTLVAVEPRNPAYCDELFNGFSPDEGIVCPGCANCECVDCYPLPAHGRPLAPFCTVCNNVGFMGHDCPVCDR